LFKKTFFVVMHTLLLLFVLASFPNSVASPSNRENAGFIRVSEFQALDRTLDVPWGDWAHYHNYSEIVETLLYLNFTYPSIVDVFSIGESWENRDIYCIKLTNESIIGHKPKVFFVGYHHAREPISAELPLYFAVEVATNFGTNQTLTRMLNSSEIYIIPALNVDGLKVISDNDWHRKNAHPFDEDGDGLLDEDPPEDEDGDGSIEDLLQWDGYQWVFVRWEGIDNDADGKFGEDWIGGVDLNRNYGYKWNASVQSGSPYPRDEDYRGPAPFSEPETQALRDLALQHDFEYAVSFHSGAENIVYPWGYTTAATSDDLVFWEIAGNLSILVGAPYWQAGDWYTTSGVWDDWMYANRSTFALTCEIYNNDSAWQYEPGPYPDSMWERGIFELFNPGPSDIEAVVQRWLPVFTYITERAISEAHNIATTGIAVSRTIVGQGFSTRINATVANQGDFPETFNVTVYANSTPIASQTIAQAERQTSTLTSAWDTAGFTKGNYVISAQAISVEGETQTDNNVRIYGAVLITMAGDVDGDRDVDIFDIVNMAILYGQTLPSTWPIPPPDIDGDGDVDIFDIVIAASNYGRHW
jgi:hypothetical protein